MIKVREKPDANSFIVFLAHVFKPNLPHTATWFAMQLTVICFALCDLKIVLKMQHYTASRIFLPQTKCNEFV